MSLGFHDSVLPCDATSFVHSDNIYGDPASLSDARIKTDLVGLPGPQALSILSNITAQTYHREDLGERRLGFIADEVEEALAGLRIDNVVGSKWAQVGEEQGMYKTLDYSRIVCLLTASAQELNKQVVELKQQLQKK